jgi:hypothetical protein
MRPRAIVAAVLGVVLACVFWLPRGPFEEQPSRAKGADGASVEPSSVIIEADPVEAQTDAAGDPSSIDLRDAPQTFRNSTLLFAIRRAGFYCGDVVSARESTDGVWLASCSDMLGYIVALRGAEQFDVHPVAQYFDGVSPVPVDRGRPLDPGSLEPQPLRK